VFDLRYHVASLAAVFFALIIGILVGVALASHGLGDTERDRLQEDLRQAQARGDALEAQLDALDKTSASDRAYVEKTYRVVAADRLQGARIAVLFVGSVDDDVQKAITDALRDASGTPLRVRAVKVPINAAALEQRLANRPFLAAYAADDKLEELGHALGQEFAAGAETPLWNALESLIVEQKDGSPQRPADGVIVVRTVPAQIGATAVFLKGLYSGMKDVGVPAVGVDVAEGDGTAIKAFKKAGLSTVDDINTAVGKLALVILLSEPAVTGDYGTKTTADDGPLPNVVPVQTTTGG
jgi:Copper transport outer membrane protein, MctB